MNQPSQNRLREPPALSPARLIVSLTLSLTVLVIVAVYTFEPDQFEHLVGRIRAGWLLAAIGTVFLRVLFGGWRLAYASDGHLRLSDGIRAQLAWDFFSNVTPSAIGGAPAAAVYIARDRRVPLGQATAIMLFSVLLDHAMFTMCVVLLLIAPIFMKVFPDAIGVVGGAAFGLLFVGLLVWLVLLVYAVLYRPEILETAADRLFRLRFLRRFRARAMDEARQLRHRAHLLRAKPTRFYLKGLGISLLLWLSRFALPLLIIRSVYVDVDSVLVFVRTMALSLGAVILPTPGGSGGIEGLYALFLGPLMPATLVAPTLLAWRVLGYYLFLALGVYLSMHQVQQSRWRSRRQVASAPVESGDGDARGAEKLAQPVPSRDG